MRHRTISSATLALASVVVLTGCPGEDETLEEIGGESAPVTEEMVARGEQLYQGSVCVSCHGAAGEGTAVGPPLSDPDWINISHDYEAIVGVIRQGIQEPQEYPAPMPPMGGGDFTDEEIRALAAYVYALAE